LVYAYQSWVMAVINDGESLGGEEKLLTDDIARTPSTHATSCPGESLPRSNQPRPGLRTSMQTETRRTCCSLKNEAARAEREHDPSTPMAARQP